MAEHAEDHAVILHRAETVFGRRPFTFAQRAIETRSRNDRVQAAIATLVSAKQLEEVAGWPKRWRVPGGE